MIDWTPLRTEIFVAEVEAGGTCKEIAARLSRRLGLLVTKNMVIGKTRRMGIKSPTPGGADGKRMPSRADDEFWLRALAMHEMHFSASGIRGVLRSRKSAKFIADGIAAIYHDDEEQHRRAA